VFEMYRVDATGNADVSAYNLPDGHYTKVAGDLTVNSDGIIEINPVIPDIDTSITDKALYKPNIPVGSQNNTSHESVFYLVEKTPPTKDGVTYLRMPGAIKFALTLSENKGHDASAKLYDWEQTAVISASESGNGSVTYLTSDGESNGIYAYKVKNERLTDITLIKVDKNTGNSIGGAKFRLLKDLENVDFENLTITAISNGAAITPEDYSINDTTIKVVTVPTGGIRIAGLADGIYTLKEVIAPAGYIITNSEKSFKTENGTIRNADDSAHPDEAADITFKVENQPGVPLPNTGGSGTNMIYIIGIMLIGLAGAGLLMRKKRRAA